MAFHKLANLPLACDKVASDRGLVGGSPVYSSFLQHLQLVNKKT